MRRESTDRGAVESEVFVGAQQEFLVVIEQVQPAFQVAEEHGDGLDPLLIGQVLDPRLANLVRGNAAGAFGLGSQIELFQLLVWEGKEIAILSRHVSPLGGN